MSPSIRFLYSTLLGLLFSLEAFASSIVIGPYTFSGEEAFPNDAEYVSGDPTYIFHPDGGTWGQSTGNTTTDLDDALTGHDITLGIGGAGVIVDLTFGAASIFNGPGADLVVFETVFEENFEIAAFVGSTLTSSRIYESVYTGLSIGDVTGNGNSNALNAVTIDLSDLGVLDGQVISKLRIYSQPINEPVTPGDITAGADIVVVGALNLRQVGIPEPSIVILLALGIPGIGFVHRLL